MGQNYFLENIASCTRELSMLSEMLGQGQDSVEVISWFECECLNPFSISYSEANEHDAEDS